MSLLFLYDSLSTMTMTAELRPYGPWGLAIRLKVRKVTPSQVLSAPTWSDTNFSQVHHLRDSMLAQHVDNHLCIAEIPSSILAQNLRTLNRSLHGLLPPHA